MGSIEPLLSPFVLFFCVCVCDQGLKAALINKNLSLFFSSLIIRIFGLLRFLVEF